jgi:hypothetical protein
MCAYANQTQVPLAYCVPVEAAHIEHLLHVQTKLHIIN